VEEDEPDKSAPVECPRCGKDTPAHKDACQWCYQALDYESAAELRAEKREVRQAALRFSKEHPELIDDVEGGTDLFALFENDPNHHEDAREFIEALSDG